MNVVCMSVCTYVCITVCLHVCMSAGQYVYVHDMYACMQVV